MNLKSIWKCPECGRQFAHHNQYHSCGHFTVKEILKSNSPRVVLLYERFAEMVKKCGPVAIEPTKTRISFRSWITFATLNLNKYGLNVHVVLSRKMKNPRFTHIETISLKNHVHHFRIKSIDELDNEVLSWLKEAFETGKQNFTNQRNKGDD